MTRKRRDESNRIVHFAKETGKGAVSLGNCEHLIDISVRSLLTASQADHAILAHVLYDVLQGRRVAAFAFPVDVVGEVNCLGLCISASHLPRNAF